MSHQLSTMGRQAQYLSTLSRFARSINHEVRLRSQFLRERRQAPRLAFLATKPGEAGEL